MALKNIQERINIPEDVEVSIENNTFKIKGHLGENQLKISNAKIKISKEGNVIVLGSKKYTKKEKKIINTFKAHIRNMIRGVRERFIYQVRICSSHFPINVSIDKNEVTVKNFFGEKKPRKARILEGVGAKINGDVIILEGIDKEKVGQTASNIEQCTRRCKFDRRIYQDGCWIIEKSGKKVK